ncbi:MAG: serine/threonine protein phosphatase, partial [Butyricicoccus sp.]
LHYPPIYANFQCGEIIALMQKYGVSRCIYGHLHSDSLRWAVTGIQDGIEFILASGDYLDFTPILLKK